MNCVKGLFDIFTTIDSIEVEMLVLFLRIELQQPIMVVSVNGNFDSMPNCLML